MSESIDDKSEGSREPPASRFLDLDENQRGEVEYQVKLDRKVSELRMALLDGHYDHALRLTIGFALHCLRHLDEEEDDGS